MENTLDKKQNIIKTIQSLAGKYGVYEIFSDWVKMMALSFSNQVQFHQKRENEYIDTIKRYDFSEQQKLAEMMAWLIEWADMEFYDMLGYIYMHLEMGSKKAGQFFTPYHLCQTMAASTKIDEDIITMNEPTCGAGGNVIALAESMKNKGINYQKNLLAVCQDIDIKAVYMTYVQLNLYGIAGVVYQSDTLSDPLGKNSGTGKMYTVNYMLHPKLWKVR